ncbi:MAG TPA: hypothetical protein VL500_05630 [Candidatus Eisenbacteria bacterium]|nr:hypothetical protein [Candidatus Eisenbacteria bacterium]
MDAEKRAAEQIDEYRKLGEQNKDIDTASLMLNALATAQREEVDAKKRRRVYTLSVVLPPIGLVFAAYYALKGEPGGKQVAINCLILTAISLFLAWGISQLLFASVTTEQTDQLQNLNVAELRKMLQQQ